MVICGVKLTHDAAIALIDNSTLVFSYELEKLDNNPRHSSISVLSLDKFVNILAEYHYTLDDLDVIVFDGWHPEWTHSLTAFPNLKLSNYGCYIAPDGNIVNESRFQLNTVNKLGKSYSHVSGHIYSAYCSSPFSRRNADSFILIWDGGMLPQLYHYSADQNKLKGLSNLFSLTGLVYQEFAKLVEPFSSSTRLEFFSLPGKVMAFAALGVVRDELIDLLKEPLIQRNIDLTELSSMEIESFNAEFISQLRVNEISKFSSPDIIASFQDFIGDLLVDTLSSALSLFPESSRNLCLAGGSALNIVWNSKVRDSGVVGELWIPPFPNDAGSAIGMACVEMVKDSVALEWDVYSGPTICENGVTAEWEKIAFPIDNVARLLHESQEPIVFLNGRAELGPRALGNRSIMAAAGNLTMKHLLNSVKSREFYRPVAPICLERDSPLIFNPGLPDPYMLFTHLVRKEWRDRLQAICHVDGTARVQTINEAQNQLVFRLLEVYKSYSGIPLLCNTSANLNGKGFFPDVKSAMQWGKLNMIWSEGFLYIKGQHSKFLYGVAETAYTHIKRLPVQNTVLQ